MELEKVLETWYPPDHPLHNDPLHPAIGLAGEAGEILDLYKKERFKNGVSWWDCVHCGHSKTYHLAEDGYEPQGWQEAKHCIDFLEPECINVCNCHSYTPKILDELGDLWYYLRVLAYQFELPIATPLLQTGRPDILVSLSQLNRYTSLVLEGTIIDINKKNKIYSLDQVNYWFFMILRELDFTLDQVTEANYQKLSKADNHGWKKARLSQTSG